VTDNTFWPMRRMPYVLYMLSTVNKMLSYRRETALQGALVSARSGRLELGDNNGIYNTV